MWALSLNPFSSVVSIKGIYQIWYIPLFVHNIHQFTEMPFAHDLFVSAKHHCITAVLCAKIENDCDTEFSELDLLNE